MRRHLLAGLCACAGAARVRLEDAQVLLQVSLVEPLPLAVSTEDAAPVERQSMEYRLKDGAVFYGFNASEDAFVSGSLARGRLWRARESSELCRLFQLAEGAADFLDVGANIGTWTVPLARCLRTLGRGGRAVAVEGVPSLAERLQASVISNGLVGDVDVYRYAVGDGDEAASEVSMYVPPTNKAASSIVSQAAGATPVNASLTTLDAIVSKCGARVFGMKLDVEGYEGHVLRGARQLLANPPCVLSLRITSRTLALAGSTVREVLHLVRSAGYDVAAPEGEQEPPSLAALFVQRDFARCRARFRQARAAAELPLPPAAAPSSQRAAPRRDAQALHWEPAILVDDSKDDSLDDSNATDGSAAAGELAPQPTQGPPPRPLSADALRSLAAAAQGVVEYTGRTGEVVIAGFDVAEDRYISEQLSHGGSWRQREINEFCRHVRKVGGRTDVLDIGANIGTWTVPLARCLGSSGGGRVLAVEPVPNVVAHLAASALRSGVQDGVDLYAFALADEKATSDESFAQRTMFVSPTNKGGSSFVSKATNVENVTVNVTTLDRLVSGRGSPIFAMKLSVEGYEGQVLRGGWKFLERQPPCVLGIETNRNNLEKANSTMEEILDLLRSAGYDVPKEERVPAYLRAVYLQRHFENCTVPFVKAGVARPDDGGASEAGFARNSKSGDSVGLVNVSYVRNPEPVSLEAMHSLVPEQLGMEKFEMRDGMVVYGFNVSEDKFISTQLSRHNLWRSRESQEFCNIFQHIRGRADFLDVGAHVGTWTVPVGHCLQSLGRGGRVIAIEGSVETAKRLEASVAHNGLDHLVEVYEYLVGDGNVTADLAPPAGSGNETGRAFINVDPQNRGGNSLVVAPSNAVRAEANMTTLDAIIARAGGKVFAMKIDVEGWEGHALRGAKELLATEPPCVLNIEVSRMLLKKAGTEVRDLMSFLHSAGYDVPMDKEPSNREVFFQQDFEHCQARFDEDLQKSNGTVQDQTTLSPMQMMRRTVFTTTPAPTLRLFDVGYVHDPQPVSVEKMSQIDPVAKGMIEYQMKDKKGEISLYGYNKSEDTFVSGMLSRGRLWESRSSSEFCAALREVDGRADFLDVGANIGTWSVPVAHCLRSHGKPGKVVAIEGMGPIAEYLEASVVRNNLTDVVAVYNYVVGDGFMAAANDSVVETPGEVTMSLDPTNKGGSSLVNRAENSTSVRTQMTTLDAILSGSHSRVFAMKMDIEGYEGHALKGAKRFLRHPPCIISIELNRKFLSTAGTPLEDVVAILVKAGFDMPEYEKGWPALSSNTYYQKDYEGCRARFQRRSATTAAPTAAES